MIRERILKSKSTYSDSHVWPVLNKGENIIVKYTDSKSERERYGIVEELSNRENPRVEVYFPDNPPKCKILGIHKGHVYKRISPVESVLDRLVQPRKDQGPIAGTVVATPQEAIDPDPILGSTETEPQLVVEKDPAPARPSRVRKAPVRLQY